MEKNSNPNATEITLPVNAFPVQSVFREKGKEHDLAAVNIDISMSIPAPKTKINTHLSIHLWRRPILIGPWSGVRSGACAIGPGDNNSRSSWVVVVVDVSGGLWYGCARGKRAIVPKKGGPRRIGGRRFSLSRSSWIILGGRRSTGHHQVRHGGILVFYVFCVFLTYFQF